MLLLMTAKQKALAAISALPENTAPQEIIKVLSRIYSIKQGIAQLADRQPGGDVQQPGRPALWGSLKGSVVIPAEIDLTAPVLSDPVDAAQGRLHG